MQRVISDVSSDLSAVHTYARLGWDGMGWDMLCVAKQCCMFIPVEKYTWIVTIMCKNGRRRWWWRADVINDDSFWDTFAGKSVDFGYIFNSAAACVFLRSTRLRALSQTPGKQFPHDLVTLLSITSRTTSRQLDVINTSFTSVGRSK